jgi:D-glycero-D-manno-heptose 1,7-bisphosphate phosphatase
MGIDNGIDGGRLEKPDEAMKIHIQPAVFLDRDGVLNRVAVRDGVPHPPDHLGEFAFLPSVPQALQRLRRAGFLLVVVTNQPDVARGTQTRARVEAMNEHVRAELPVLDVLTCYHDTADGCGCRKPKPGLLFAAVQRWCLDPGRSFMIGDRWSDVAAGQAAGCRTVLLDRSYSGRNRCTPDYCAADLPEAVSWILG